MSSEFKMVESVESKHPWELLTELIEAGERRSVRTFVAELEPIDTARVVLQLREDDRARLIEMLRPEAAADVLEHIPEDVAGDALESIAPRKAARILEELSSAEQADLIGELDEEDAETILSHMEPAEAQDLRELAAYDEESAGGLMIREFAHVRAGCTVAQVVDYLSENDEDLHLHGQYVYVEDELNKLVGSLQLRDLLLAHADRRIDGLMNAKPLRVRDDALLPELVNFFEQEHLYGVPVVTPRGVLVGLLRRAAIEEALAEQSEADFRASQGIVGGEELRSMPLAVRSRRRFSWLSVNILLNVAAASVIALHQETLQAVIALAVFLPIISDMSGCSGNQAVAVSMRELTLGVTRPADIWRVVLAEAKVGLVNGAALGVLIGLVAWLWKGNLWLGLVVGTALALNTLVAVCIGGGIPLLLKRLGRDPALASGPILTTITDMCGFLLVLSMASAAVERL
jgi:magnesium transporter